MESRGISLGELAVRFGCKLKGDPDARVNHVAKLEAATPDAVSFLANPKYRAYLATTRAGVVVLDEASAADCSVPVLVTKAPYLVYARIASVLHPPPNLPPGVHVSAVVDAAADVHPTAHIAANVVIGAGCRIAAHVAIGPGCVLGMNVIIAQDTRLMANVTLCDGTVLGERCIVNPHAVIGSEGFGFAPDQVGGWVKVPQVGSVRIGNDVEIGACTTIDRGAIGDTVIEDGVKLDNQIQIAHNVHIGAHTAMAACVGISGSTVIGRHCMIAGQVGIAGHLNICDNVVITGKSMVSASINKPGVYSGSLHAEEAGKFRRNAARFARLDDLAKEVRQLRGKHQPDPAENTKID